MLTTSIYRFCPPGLKCLLDTAHTSACRATLPSSLRCLELVAPPGGCRGPLGLFPLVRCLPETKMLKTTASFPDGGGEPGRGGESPQAPGFIILFKPRCSAGSGAPWVSLDLRTRRSLVRAAAAPLGAGRRQPVNDSLSSLMFLPPSPSPFLSEINKNIFFKNPRC
uniref:Uncharacterized protein n=1 Tax=Myotis myotis TaxID=51298 RepID=A0A7J7SRX0_MYOMY|nr:hypothetical protein mMyoMyo1_009375 [Myotis myotis]